MKYRRAGSGFSLVELLIVIGIIALLIAMLLPTLSKARGQANWVKCQSNMRQVGIELQMYANEWRGAMYPPLRGANLPENQRWTAIVFDQWNPKVMLCDSDIEPVAQHSYILNSHLWEKGVKFSSRDFGGRPSSEVVLLGEKKTDVADYYMDAGENFDRNVELYRHGLRLGSNYLFVDLHVGLLNDRAQVRHQVDPWDIPIPAQPQP